MKLIHTFTNVQIHVQIYNCNITLKMNNHTKVTVITIVTQLLDSSDDDDIIMISNRKSKKKRKCIKNYVQNTALQYTPDEFKSHFRITRETFAHLLEVLGQTLYRRADTSGRHKECPEKQLLVVLAFLCNQEVYRNISEKFDISKSTAHVYLHRICNEVVKLSNNYIKWPSTRQTILETTTKFKERHNFPNVIGAIDGSHIPISAPKTNPITYYNRKKYYSIILQAVCNADYIFTDVCAGYPGSMHDARVFRNSDLGKKIRERPNDIFLYDTHILGDSAYPNTQYVLTPYRDNGHLTRVQKNYNFKHSSTRVYIEQAFGILKSRFRILKYVHVYNTENIPSLIVACCVLHNLCMLQGDEVTPDPDVNDDIDPLDYPGTANIDSAKRNEIANRLLV